MSHPFSLASQREGMGQHSPQQLCGKTLKKEQPMAFFSGLVLTRRIGTYIEPPNGAFAKHFTNICNERC